MKEQQMRNLEDCPGFRTVAEKIRALEDEQRQEQERKAAIQSEAKTASPSARVALDSSWRGEYQQLESREPLLREQIEIARLELDRIRGQLSLQICQQRRPAFVEQARRVLRALKEISDANSQLEQLRDELEQTDVTTGSITHCIFTMDKWSAQYGGQVSGYQRWIREHIPE
jgi:hypothetical protein